MKNNTMKKAMVMVKDWAERNKKAARDLGESFDTLRWQLDTFLVENFGRCGEWEGSNETPPTSKQEMRLKKVIANVYGWNLEWSKELGLYCYTRIAK